MTSAAPGPRARTGARRAPVPMVVLGLVAASVGFALLAPSAPSAATGVAAAAAGTGAGTAPPVVDAGAAPRLVPAAAPVVRRVLKLRCLSWRYSSTTRRTTCLRVSPTRVTARFTGAVVQQRDARGRWVRVPYVWSPRKRALIYSHWLHLQLRRPTTPPPAPTPGPTTTSPTTTSTPPTSSPPSTSPSTSTTTSPPTTPPTTTGPTTTSATTPPQTIAPTAEITSPTPTSTSLVGEQPDHAGSYVYLAHSGADAQDAATAVRWDRCTVIRWTVDFTRVAAAGSTRDVELARTAAVMRRLADVTGSTFVYVDTGTGQVPIDPATDRPAQSSFAATGADIVVTYASDADPGAYRSDALAGSTVGLAGPWYWQYPSAWIAFRGDVQLDYTFIATASEALRTDLYLHEIGHVLGLGHVGGDSSQVMYPMVTSADAYRLGDRTGLWALGRQPCLNP